MQYVIAIHGIAGQGMISPAVFLKNFDHEAMQGRGDGEMTANAAEAMTFDDNQAAMRFWQRISKTAPTRQDGKPNRPLTVYHVSIETLDKAAASQKNDDVVGLSILTAINGDKLTDECFSIVSRGEEITWNVTRMSRDAKAGRFGPIAWAPMSRIPPSDWSNGYLSRERVDQIKTDRAMLDDPAIAVEAPDRDMLRCFVDGQHRITARQELGLDTVFYYVVPFDMEREYRILTEAKS